MEILNQFGVQPILLAAQVVNFIILLLILKKFMYKPLLKVLDERRQKIADSLKNAEQIEKKLSDTNIEVEKILGKAVNEGQKILDQTNETAAQILIDTNKQAELILLKAVDQGKKIMELQKQVLMDQMKQNAGHLVNLVFEKVTGKDITGEDQKKLIEKEVRNLS